MSSLWIYFYLGLSALLISWAFAPLCKKLSRRFGIVDTPDPRKNHKGNIPLLGGVAIFAAFNAVVFGHILAAALLSSSQPVSATSSLAAHRMNAAIEYLPRLLVIGGGGLGFFLTGLLDDRRVLSVKARFVIEFLLAGGLVAAGVRFDLGFLPKPAGMALTVVWIVGMANAFNLLDGLDGLAAGVTVICSSILAVVLVQGGQPLVAMYAVALAGSAAGFLRYNFHPASIFMGSSGSLFLGYTLGVSVVIASFRVEGTSAAFPLLMPVLLLAVPLYDTASVVFIRLRERRPIFSSDRSHTHHRLLAAGFSERSAVVFIWLLTFMVGISSVILLTAPLWLGIMIFLQATLAFALILLAKHMRLRNPAGPDSKN